MTDPRLNLKNPLLAGILAFLVPGAGHLYQGRLFKSAIYFCCIFGAFLVGLSMGEWRVVAASHDPSDVDHHFREKKREMNIGFLAQAPVGIFSIPALIQNQRYTGSANKTLKINSQPSQDYPFMGSFHFTTSEHENLTESVTGTLSLDQETEFVEPKGTFQGMTANGQELQCTITSTDKVGQVIRASPRRSITCYVTTTSDDPDRKEGKLIGNIPRPVRNWFAVPLDAKVENDLYRRLGRKYHIALVFTWVAGLLNILAIWDAVEGPAYGYGDEPDPSAEENRNQKEKIAKTSKK